MTSSTTTPSSRSSADVHAPDTLFLDPVGGIAGDMFLAACLELGVSLDALNRELAKLGPLGFQLETRVDERTGTRGTHLDVVLAGEQPHHRAYVDIVRMIDDSTLSPRVKETAQRVFRVIGEAEARVHGMTLEAIHFHEVGAVDSIVDVCGAAICLELLGWPRVLAAPPPSGGGTIPSAHGIIPVPAPATIEILRGRRMRPSGPGERTTPTGAGLLAALAEEVSSLPDLVIDRIGYGVGTKLFDDAPNVLRAVLGRKATGHAGGEILLLETNLDDATGQLLARAVDALLEAGAADAWLTPIVGKKGRPGHVLSALVEGSRVAALQDVLFRETTTLGVRVSRWERLVLDREWREVTTPFGSVRMKLGLRQGRVVNATPEHDDCLRLAREAGVPLKDVLQAASAAWSVAAGSTVASN